MEPSPSSVSSQGAQQEVRLAHHTCSSGQLPMGTLSAAAGLERSAVCLVAAVQDVMRAPAPQVFEIKNLDTGMRMKIDEWDKLTSISNEEVMEQKQRNSCSDSSEADQAHMSAWTGAENLKAAVCAPSSFPILSACHYTSTVLLHPGHHTAAYNSCRAGRCLCLHLSQYAPCPSNTATTAALAASMGHIPPVACWMTSWYLPHTPAPLHTRQPCCCVVQTPPAAAKKKSKAKAFTKAL
jgi:hypothetical protein